MLSSAYGNGSVLRTVSQCDVFFTKNHKDVPYLTSSAVYDEENRSIVIFAVNRSQEEDMELTLNLENFGDVQIQAHVELYHEDIKAVNGKDAQRVKPQDREITEGPLVLKKHSWNMIRISC